MQEKEAHAAEFEAMREARRCIRSMSNVGGALPRTYKRPPRIALTYIYTRTHTLQAPAHDYASSVVRQLQMNNLVPTGAAPTTTRTSSGRAVPTPAPAAAAPTPPTAKAVAKGPYKPPDAVEGAKKATRACWVHVQVRTAVCV